MSHSEKKSEKNIKKDPMENPGSFSDSTSDADGDENIWGGEYKIPWHDPGFSRRMLDEHLSQAHDLASRRTEWLDRQVAWIHAAALSETPSRILDLGCGPGFYAHRLAALGHRLRGIDFSPASIDYAQSHNPRPERCRFALGDILAAAFAGPHDLAMLLYGEINVFPPADALAILRKARASLVAGGKLIIEPQTFDAVRGMGLAEPSEQRNEAGLFSEHPHICRTENRWFPDKQVARQTFTITDLASGESRSYRNTTKAWSDDALRALLADAGFADAAPRPDWPCDNPGLQLWEARIPS